jgi:NADH-quinone oxidoreductase subunit E
MNKIKVEIVDVKTNSHYQQILKDGDRDFAWSDEQKQKIKEILKKYPKKQSAIMPILHLAQDEFDGWLPKNLLKLVAETLQINLLKVTQVASFYSMFNLKPMAKYHLQVCSNCSCMMNGSGAILDILNIEIGEMVDAISEDGLFTISEVECLGHCDSAPVMQVNKTMHANLNAEKVKNLISSLKKQ